MRTKLGWGLLLVLGGLLHAGPAQAYPSAVVFAPSGEAKAQGQASAFMYTAYFGGSPLTWAGFNVGTLPGFEYGSSGLRFGGLEVGLDVASYTGQNPAVKPIAYGKAQLLVETGAWPSLAVGFGGAALGYPDRSLNAGYVSATKALSWGDTSLGRITLGGGGAFPGSADLFRATAPFAAGSPGFALAGYESPAWGPAYVAVDHIGGVSELGGTNVALNVELNPGTYLGIGYTMGNDRSVVPADAVFVYIAPAWTLGRK